MSQVAEGDSLAAQRDALLNYISSHSDLVLAGEYMDDGVSGQKYAERDELQRMLADVEAGKIDLIICTKMDRLHRSLKNFLAMQEALDKHGVKWLAIWEPMYDTSTPAGQLIINQMMSFAQFEAQNTGARIRQVLDYKISQGQVASGKVPCGYSIQDRRLVPNGDADAVRAAFEMYSLTGNLCDTQRQMCGMYPCLPMLRGSFRSMLTNRKYIGECRNNKDYCEPIIDIKLFDDVQRKLSMNIKPSQKRTYLFSGLLVCRECGRRMNGRASQRTPHTKTDRRYRCAGHSAPTRICDNSCTISEQKMEEYLLSHLKDEIKKYVITCKEAARPVEDNRHKIEALKKKIDRLKELYVNELITLDEYKKDKERYTEDIDKLSKAELPNTVDTTKLERLLQTDITGYYDTLSAEEKRYFWRSIIKRITFSSDRSLTIEFL